MTSHEINEMNTIVKKSNMLARAAWSPDSIWESRLVAIVAAQVHKDDEAFKMYSVPIKDLLSATNITNTGRVYKALDELTDKAMTRLIKIKHSRGWVKYTLFGKCEFIKGSGALAVRFDPDLKPHYLDLKKHFTTYSLSEYLSLPSIYSQRIYEILRSWDDCVTTEISMQDLHEMLCTPASMRSNFAEFKRSALNKAHKDIHKYTKLKFEWEPIKKGRKVVAVRFYSGRKTMIKVKTKKMLNYNSKQSENKNELFKQAAECAKIYHKQGGCGTLKDTKLCCKACFIK